MVQDTPVLKLACVPAKGPARVNPRLLKVPSLQREAGALVLARPIGAGCCCMTRLCATPW